jgi:hypothetical protein
VVTKEAIERRVAELRGEREALIAQVNAFGGAIDDCLFWLAALNEGVDDDYHSG